MNNNKNKIKKILMIGGAVGLLTMALFINFKIMPMIDPSGGISILKPMIDPSGGINIFKIIPQIDPSGGVVLFK